MKKSISRILAVLLSAVMLLSVMSGCDKSPANQNEGTTSTPALAGMLMLNAGVALNISYDADGMVLKVEGANDPGLAFATAYTDYLGKSCSTVVKELVALSAKEDYLKEAKSVVLKMVKGSATPTELFLDALTTDLTAAVKDAGSSAAVVSLGLDALDKNGYIGYETVQTLLCADLGVEKLDAIYGSTTPYNDAYIFTIEIGGVEYYRLVDANTGLVSEASMEDIQGDTGYIEPTESQDNFYEEFTPDNIEEFYDAQVPGTDETLPEETIA